MMKRYGLSWSLVLLCVMFAASAAKAQWVRDGIPVGSAENYQDKAYIVPDGAGGGMIAWQDYRTGADYDIYGNRVGADGSVYGGPGGVPLCSASGNQYFYGGADDGMGGVVVVWIDERSGSQQIYAQKIDTTGFIYWASDGINISPSALYPGEPNVIPDGAGGVFITWADYRNGSNDIYVQRVDADGDLLYGDAGMPVCLYGGDQYAPKIASDRHGGAVIAWQDQRSAMEIYAQRIDDAGTILWDTAGVAVCTAGGYVYDLQVISNAGGEPYVAWTDQRYGYNDVFVQYLDLSGAPVWQIDGVSVCDDAGSYYYKNAPKIVADGLGGVVVAWWDYRGDTYNVYGQHVAWDGARAWGPKGKMLVPAYSFEGPFSMISDGFGAIILGVDLYPGENTKLDIYAQKVDVDGNLLWGARGVPVSLAESYQYATKLTPDGSGGAIFAWEDYRPDDMNSDIYCQRIGASGLWGNPEPEILSCADVPADQGGWVRITTGASPLDVAGEQNGIFGYNVWRLIDSGGPLAASANAAWSSTVDRSKLFTLLSDPTTAVGVRIGAGDAIVLGLPEGDWESVGFWFATRDTVYNIAVPTRNDSTETGVPLEVFIVTAHTSMAGVFVASEPDTGYSVDNLAPGVTPGFAGSETASPAGLQLTWTANTASDIWKYNVYRGDNEFFVPDETSLLGATLGTGLHDDTWVKAYNYFYKLVAVDRHGNMGPEALLRPEDINVGTLLQSFVAVLSGSAVKVSWTLSEFDEDVAFSVLRSEASGSFEEIAAPVISREGLSFTMSDGAVEPGTTYRYRVNVVEESGARTLFETDELSTPAMPLTLHQNHPNPFNPSTTISYYLPGAGPVTLEVYDSSGRLVSRLLDGVTQERGTHSIGWRGLDGSGRSVSSGVYFYRLRSGKETISKKMVLLR